MILERNARIICRRIDGKGMLYDPDRRDAKVLNPAGMDLYCRLGLFTDADMLLCGFAGDDADKRREAEKFLGMLQKYGYIAGYSGDITGEEPSAIEIMGEYGIGYSMSGTFFPGDRLIMVPVKSERLQYGDVICFTSASAGAVAHRIIGGGPGAWITMGDNNPAPDKGAVTADDLQLVTAVIRDGVEHPVAGGAAGMRCFRKWRCRRFFRLLMRKIFTLPVRAVINCCFWCRTPERATDFGRLIQYSDRGRLIGWRIGGVRVFAAHRFKFIYRLPEEL